MAVISVRMNKEEEAIMERLSSYYEVEKSTIIKRSLMDMYEDIIDKNEVANFEKKEDSFTFVSAEEILNSI